MDHAASPRSSGAWLDRYRGPVGLREGRHFELLTAVRVSDRAASVIVRPGPDARPGPALARLRALADAHARIAHPLVPSVGHLHDDPEAPYLELAADVATDVRGLVRALSDQRTKIPYAQALVLVDAVLDAVEAAHARGLVLGRLSLDDVWLAPDAQPSVIGWGAHVTIERDDGSIDASLGHLEHPDLALGAEPAPAHDLALALLFARALAHVVEPPAAVKRALAGRSSAADRAALERLAEIDRTFLAQLAPSRPSFAEGRAALREVRSALGVTPDPEGLARSLETALARSAEHDLSLLVAQEPTERVITVHARGEWVDGQDGRTGLGPSLRAILAHLLRTHREAPAKTTSLWELLEIGWPGERPIPEAGANRVYAAIRRIRKTGLGGALEWHEGGYRIAPSAQLTTID